MNCPSGHAALAPGQRFCPSCGAPAPSGRPAPWRTLTNMGERPTRRSFLFRAAALGGAVLSQAAAFLTRRPTLREAATEPSRSPQSVLTHGPFLGDVTPTSARVWARCEVPGSYRLVARGSWTELVATGEARPENDLCVVWRVNGLEPQQRYRYEITSQDQPVVDDPDGYFLTPPSEDSTAVTRLAIGSCAREDPGSRAVWRRMAALDPHAIVLLGDTPYIDSTDLGVQRRRYAEFAAVPEFAGLLRNRPLYATWDDHDFGANDSDGRLSGKENARQVFVEFHANPSYGDGQEGVYTKFRQGGVEVFLLDTRYFAGTEQSPISAGPTLLGTRQWEWLREELRSSTADFKLLASGMIWNAAVRPGKTDHWGSYSEEREALFRFLGTERITGIVLVGGDVHRTRVLRYDTTDIVGYPLTELITSPIHASVIDAADAPHSALIHDSGEPHSFLFLTIDTTVTPSTLHARFQNADGRELSSLTLDAAALSA